MSPLLPADPWGGPADPWTRPAWSTADIPYAGRATWETRLALFIAFFLVISNLALGIPSVNAVVPTALDDAYTVAEGGSLSTVGGTWHLPDWRLRRSITFNNTGRGQLDNFPVMVKLDPADIDYTRTQSLGQDLRFVDSDGTPLAYEIEEWNTGGSFVWVKVPQIDAGSTTDFIWMYYDNGSVGDGQNPGAVWSNGYVGVWHMDQNPAASQILDSTSYGNHGTSNNMDLSNLQSGQIGDGLFFDGSAAPNAEFIRVPSDGVDELSISGALPQLTLEAWVRRTGTPTGQWMIAVGRQLGVASVDSYMLATVFNAPDVESLITSDGVTPSRLDSSPGAVPFDQWRYLTGVRDGNNMVVYSNGSQVGTIAAVSPMVTDVNDVTIGAAENDATPDANEAWRGLLDEIRISDIARSADWVNAQHASMADTFGNYGLEEEAGVLANDTDPESDPLTASLVSGPLHAAVFGLNPDGSFNYTPVAGMSGTDIFTYVANDGTGDSNVATVTITVTPTGPNNPPDVVDDPSEATNQDVPVVINVLANDSDPDLDGLTVSVVTQGANGSVVNNGTDVTYTPNALWTGVDTFTYEASDGNGGFDTATVTVTVSAPAGLSISGTVFEDVAGDVLNDGVIGDVNNPGAVGVDVYLYEDTNSNAVLDVGTDTLVAGPVATNASGAYSFSGLTDLTNYFVRVDSKTVPFSQDPAALQGDLWAEQTYAPTDTWCADGTGGAAQLVAGGPCYGGRDAAVSDSASAPEHYTMVSLAGASVTGVDYGFSHNVMVNTLAGGNADDDLGASRTVQGSLRQFIQNANATSGANLMRFVPAVPANDGTWWEVSVTNPLPAMTNAGTTVDGTAYQLTDGSTLRNANAGFLGANAGGGVKVGVDDVDLPQVEAPELEIQGDQTAPSPPQAGFVVQADSVTIKNLAIYGFGDHTTAGTDANIQVGPSGGPAFEGIIVEQNVIGAAAGGFADPGLATRTDGNDIYVVDAISGGVGQENRIRDNLIGFAYSNGIMIITNTSGWLVTGNEVRSVGLDNASGAYMDTLAFEGTSSSGHSAIGNLITQTGGPGIDTWRSPGGHTIENNDLVQNGSGGIETAGLRIFGTASTVSKNVITNNTGPGVIVVGERPVTPPTWTAATDNRISQNQFGTNSGIAIDLVESTDLQAPHGQGDGVTLTVGTLATTGNNGLDAPVITAALTTTVSGTTCANCEVEVYKAVAGVGDDSGGTDYGEGVEYLDTATADGGGNWSVTGITTLIAGDEVSAIAIDGSNDTSEFGANFTVTGTYSISGTVFEDIAGDVLNDGAIGDANNPYAQGVDVYLYDGLNALVGTDTTDASGDYSFTGLATDTYTVWVDSKTVPSAQDPAATAGDIWAVQTYGATDAVCADGSGGTTTRATPGPCYGGSSGALSDNSTTKLHRVVLTNLAANTTGVDFGFSFNVVVNTRGGDATDDDLGSNRTVQGSLRQFIQNAVAIDGANAMRFVPVEPADANDGGGNDWWSVPVTQVLPTVSAAATTIDGTAYQLTDGSTVRNTNALGPELELNGNGTPANTDGLLLTGGTSAVRDLVINRFARDGIRITTAGTNTIAGNYLGVDATGTSNLVGNGNNGIFIISTPSNTIGGLAAGDRNVVSGNNNNGLLIDGVASTGNIIQGNYVGLNAAGTAGIGNTDDGVDLSDAPGNTVGGTDPAARNVISGQGDVGLLFVGNQATGNVAVNNFIGTNAAGTAGVPNLTGASVHNAAAGNRIGGINANESNLIAYNTGDGVWVTDTAGVNNAVLRNSIHSNGGLGIDMALDGVTANGAGDPLNFPVITSATENAGTVTVDFDLDAPAGDYRIEFFDNTAADVPTGYGEGETFLDFFDVVAHPGGSASYSTTFAGSAGDILTATTTEDLGASFGSTSEFSAAYTAVAGAFVVNSTGDAGDNSIGDGLCDTGGTNSQGADECTLRAAIEEANFAADADTINFNMPATEAGHSGGVWTTVPTAPYDDIVETVTIDATTQPGFSGDPIVQLDGSDPGADLATAALTLEANDSLIEGFIVHSWDDEGLEIDATTGKGDNNTLRNNWVGIDAGEGLQSIGDIGILVTVGANDNTIDGNVVGGAANSGIVIRNLGSDNNVVIGNSIGVGPDGSSPIPNGLHGIELYDQVAGNRIGGTGAGEPNLIANNTGAGIAVNADSGTGNAILENSILANGGLGIDHGINGVTPNGAGDPLNFPVITAASESAGTVTVDFDLDVPAGNYRIEFFTNMAADIPTGYGEGETFATFYDVVGHLGGPASFSVPLSGAGWVVLTATTTEDLGAGSFGSTSEFSAGVPVVRDTLVVNSTGDASDDDIGDGVCFTGGTNIDGDPECTLRAAMEEAEALAGADTVNFNIPSTEPGYTASPLAFTLNPASQYPAITGPLTLDATSQPEYTGDPIIQLDGTLAIGATAGLAIEGSNSTIAGFIIHSFLDEGMEIDGIPRTGDNNTIRNNWVGVDASGVVQGNTDNGILITDDATGNLIGGTGLNDGNVIAGSGNRGINIRLGSIGNSVIGNSIYSNTQLGIDLNQDGVTENDPVAGDPDSGPNDLLNFPVITSAGETAGTLDVDFDLDLPAGNYRIEFFTNTAAHSSGNGEGETLVATYDVVGHVAGSSSYSTSFAGSVGDILTATTTENLGAGSFGSTSEFSDTYTVANTPPAFVPPLADQTDPEGPPLISLSVAATDPDTGDTLTYSATGLPLGLTLNTSSGLITGLINHAAEASSPYSVQITVDDGVNTPVSDTFTWTVTDVPATVPYVVAGTGGANGGDDLLTNVDETSFAAATNEVDIGTGTGTTSIEAIATDPTTGTLFAVDGGQFGSLDTDSGVFTPIGTGLGTPGNGVFGAVVLDDVRGLAFHPLNERLYGVHRRAGGEDVLFRIDVATGAYIPGAFPGGDDYRRVQAKGSLDDVTDIAVDPLDWQMYAVMTDGITSDLVTVKRNTGKTRSVGTLAAPLIGLSFDTGGQLWGTDTGALYAVDKTDASLDAGRTLDNGSNYGGLAFGVNPAVPPSLEGTVFEDLDGNALGVAEGPDDVDNPGLPGVSVHLYRDLGVVGVPEIATTDTILDSTVTGPAGHYFFDEIPVGPYWIVVDSTTIAPVAGGTGWAEQTYAPVGAVIDPAYTLSPVAGPLYGGMQPTVSDDFNASGLTAAEHLAYHDFVAAEVVEDIDFGFSFNVVTNLEGGDAASPQGSLRQFLTNAADGTGPNPMRFVPVVAANDTDGGGNNWWSLAVTSALPLISDAGTTVDGSAFDSTDGITPLDPNGAGPELEIDGPGAAAMDGLTVTSADNTIRNLVIGGFTDVDRAAVLIFGVGATGNTIAGNYLGTTATGNGANGNRNGVRITGGANNNTIGGTAGADLNVISGNLDNGVLLNGAGSNGNTVQGNYIGTESDGSSPLANSSEGIALDAGTAGNLIGGTALGAGNRIANNGSDGIDLKAAAGSGNSILGNTVLANGGMGIDLAPNGVTANDAGDGDAGPNDLLNFPVITSATHLAGTVTVDFDLDVPDGNYRVEFFTNTAADPSGNGEGETFVSSVDVSVTGGVPTPGSHSFAGSLGDILTATATEDLGGSFGSTSEFSDSVAVVNFDVTPPVISLVGVSPVDVEAGTAYVDAGATATDNIDGDISGSIVTVNPVNTAVLGPYLVTYNVTDSSGNAAVEVTRTVNVVDTVAPVITLVGADPVSVALNDTYVDAGATAVDAFEGDLTGSIVTVNPVDTTTLGSYTVTYNVSDSSLNAAVEVTRTVDVVLDVVAPVISLVGADPVDVEAGTAYVDAGATATDNIDGDISGSIVTVNPVNTAVLGPYLVTYNVTDSSGNAAVEVTRTVNVVDTVAPVITLVGADPVSVALNDTYVDAGATAVDAFEGDLTGSIVTVNPVDTTTLGSYTVTYNVSDSSLNAAVEVTRTVDVVLDVVAPVISLVGADPVDVEAGTAYVDAGATATDNIDGDISGSIVTVNPVNTAVLGPYLVTYNVTDSSGNAAVEVTRTVNVVDTVAPVITLVGADPVSVALNDTYVDAGATAVDAFEGDLTGSIVTVNPVDTTTLGSYTVTYNVSDSSLNAAVEVTRTVDVVLDVVAPVISLVGADPVDVEAGTAYVDAGATATDNIDGDISGSIVTVNPVNTAVLGPYLVTYNVTDSSGNAAVEVTRTVNVVDTVAPVITLVGADPVSVALNDTYVDAGATAVDAFEGDLTGSIVTVNPVDTTTLGSYTVTYNVSDSSLNAAVEVTRTVDVVLDVVAPVISLVGADPVDVEAGTAYVDAGATATDNIDGDISGSIVTVNPVNTAVLGPYLVTYNVTDSSGNAAVEVTRTVNVVDTVAPVITLVGADPVSVALNDTYVDAGATAVDAFEGDLTGSIVTVNPVDTTTLGSYTVTYNVSDSSLNAAVEVTRTVDVVLDVVAPVISLVGADPVDVEAGTAYVDAGATATDNIDGDISGSIVTVNPVNTAVLGPYLVTYNVTDSSGNAAVEVTRTVNVVDTVAPVITLVGADPVSVALNDTYVDAGATAVDAFEGDLTGSIVTVNPVDTTTLGSYTVTYNVSDSSLNAAVEVTRTVDVVLDVVAPVISLVGADPVDVEAGTAYVDAGATATDNIDGDISGSIVTVNPVNTAVLGPYLVTYNVTDSSGNAAVEVTRTVNVVDTVAPVITLVGADPVSVALNDTYVDAGATAVDAFEGDLTGSIVTVNPVDTTTLGSYTVTYNVSDSSLNAAVEVTRTVDVVLDVVAPVISLVGADPVDVEAGTAYVDAGATATDNIDGDISGSIVTVNPVNTAVLGPYLVTYNVTDSSGNAAVEVTRTVNVVDTVAPVITLVGADPVSVALNDTYVDAGATAVDAFEGDLTGSIVTVNPVDTTTLGSYTVTYNVSDSSLNAAVEVTRTVDVVLDVVAPVISLVGADPVDVEAGTAYVDAGATATDNIDGDISGSIVTVNPVNTAVLGPYLVTYNVTDSSGNAAVEVTRTVNVVDTVAPVITLVGADPVSVALNDTYVDAGATAVDAFEGDLTGSIVTVNPVDTTTLGSYTVTYNVSDSSLNAAVEVTRTVDVVLDVVAPVISLVGADPVDVEAGTAYVDAGATATDNIDGDISGSIVTVNPVNTAVLGPYLVTYNVTDSSGNAAVEVTRTVNVVDTVAPVITLVGADPVSVALNDTYVDAGATAVDAFEGDLTGSIVTVNPVDTTTLGSYTVTYNVSDSSLNAAVEVTRTVDVVLDVVAPVISLVGADPVDVEAGTAYVDAGATATDNIDGDISGSIVTVNPVNTAVLGPYLVTYNVTDSSGNAAVEVTRTVNVVDTVAPVITLVGADPVSVALNDTYVDAGATAVDAFEGDLTGSIVTVNPVDTTTLGSYTVTYNVSDSSLNAAVEVTRTVDVVLDVVAPVISLVGADPVDVEAGTAYVDAGATATDNIDGDISGSIVTVNPVNTAVLGPYLVTYNVTDSSGNAAVEVTRTVNVVDTVAPVITLVGANPQTIDFGSPYVELGATALDNYDGDISGSIVIDSSAVDTTNPGVYAVTYDVADSSGNSALQEFRLVQVLSDAVPPVITLLGDNPQTVAAGTPYVELGATATDNIDGDLTGSIAIDASAVNTAVAGSYTVSYEVSDSSGNTTTVFRTVDVVVVNLPPLVVNPGVQTTGVLVDVALQISASDPDGDPLTFVAAGLPPGLSISSGGLISGVVPVDGAGTYPVTVTVTDDGLPALSDSASFVWVVTDNNQAPLATNDQYTVDEGATLVVGPPGVLGNDSDPDAESLTAALVNPPTRGTLTLAADGSFVYTHTAGDAIDDSFTYVATDSRGATGLAVAVIRVVENLAPLVVADLISIDEDTVGTASVLANDSDPEGASLTIVGIEQPANGVVTLTGDGDLSFAPPQDWFGTTRFFYLASDGRKSSRGLVTVLVASVNDAPVGGRDSYRFTLYGPAVLDVLANDSDVDGDELSVLKVNGVTHALAEVVDGRLVYNAHSEWLGTETFSYTLSDGRGAQVDVVVSVTMAEEALAAANALTDEVGAPEVPFDSPEASPEIGSISLGSPKGVSLLAGAFFDSFDALKLPLVFLVIALVWALVFGGLFSSPWFLFGARKRFWSIVLVDRESMVPVYTEPNFESPTVYNYPPSTQNIRSTGAPKRLGNGWWMPIDTPNGEGWVDAYYLTQEVDDETFANDKRPAQLAAKFVTALTAGNARAMKKLVSKRGLAAVRFGTPVVVPLHRLKALLSGEKEPGWWRSDAVTAMEALFPERLAEPFLSSYWAGNHPAESGKVATLLVPAEVRNFHRYTYSNAEGTWWLLFEYRKNKLTIAGIALAE